MSSRKYKTRSRRSSSLNRRAKRRTASRKVKSAPSDWNPINWPTTDYKLKYPENMKNKSYMNKY